MFNKINNLNENGSQLELIAKKGKNNMTNKTNDINIFAVEEIVEISELFKKEDKTVSAIMLKDTDLKMQKNNLDVHGSDLNGFHSKDGKVVLSVCADTDKKYHQEWYELKEFGRYDILEDWKLTSERISYRD